MARLARWLTLLMAPVLLIACGPQATATPEPTATLAPGETPAPTATATPSANTVTFVVGVPANTPEEDAVFLASGPFFARVMNDLGDGRWSLTLDWVELTSDTWGTGPDYAGPNVVPDGTFRYTYTRGWGDIGAEAGSDAPEVEFWANLRTYDWEAGATVNDTVDRWRWLPVDGETLPAYDATLTEWAPRLNGEEFQAGVLLADLWDDTLIPLARPTNEAAKRGTAATWVAISPPWDYGGFDPVPIMGEDVGLVPAYKGDALREHLLETKADGLKILLLPQICCTPVPGNPRSDRDRAWVDAWFGEYTAFLVFHAKIAQETGVDAFLLDWSGAHFLPSVHYDAFTIEELQARWADVIAAVRAEYDGPVGFNLLPGNGYEEWREPWPWDDFSHIADLFDFLGMALWAGLADMNDATQAELDDAAERLFEASFDPVFEASGLPQVISSIAFGSFDGAAKNELGVFDVALDAYFPEADSAFVDDHVEQAMVFQAIMKAVASRPYVVGTHPFLYQYLALPAAADYSIRGKAAESVVAEWYRLATGR